MKSPKSLTAVTALTPIKVKVRTKVRPFYGVYKIKCHANKKVYIGVARDCEKRMRNHITILRAGTHRNKVLQGDFNTYGEGRFQFKVIEKLTTHQLKGVIDWRRTIMLRALQGKWIAFFQSDDKSRGYNTTSPVNFVK